MLLSLIYLSVYRLLRLLTAGGDRDEVARDVQILILRCVCSQEVAPVAAASGQDPA